MLQIIRIIAVIVLTASLMWHCNGERVTQFQTETNGPPLGKLTAAPTVASQAVVVVNLSREGAPVSGAKVAFSRAIAGRVASYQWSGMTDEMGQARVEIAADNVTGYYRARAWQDGSEIGSWSSIPVNSGYEVMLNLPIGGKARVTESSKMIMSDKSGAVNGLTLSATYKNLGYTFDFGIDNSVVVTTSDEVTKTGSYLQSGQNVDVTIGGYVIHCTYDGTHFAIARLGESDKSGDDAKDDKSENGESDKSSDDAKDDKSSDDAKDDKSENLDLGEYSEFSYSDSTRYYLLYKPRDLPENAPLIFMLHGYGGNPEYLQQYSNLNSTADANGFAVVYPLGSEDYEGMRHWNARLNVSDTDDTGLLKSNTDDIGFLSSLARFLQAEHNLSPEKTFVAGVSNGGMMAYVLGMEAPNVFNGVASIIGTMTGGTWENRIPTPFPLLQLSGVNDEIIPISGWGGAPGMDTIIDYWREQNSCLATETVDINSNNTLYKHRDCNANVEIWYYKITNFGHEWPYANNSAGVDGNQILWEFFSRF